MNNMEDYKNNPEVKAAVDKLVELGKLRQDFILAAAKADVKLKTEYEETPIGSIPMSRQFTLDVELNFVSAGDFSKYLAEDPTEQKKLNDKLRNMVIEFFASQFNGLSIKK